VTAEGFPEVVSGFAVLALGLLLVAALALYLWLVLWDLNQRTDNHGPWQTYNFSHDSNSSSLSRFHG